MKKTIVILLALCLCIGLCACQNSSSKNDTVSTEPPTLEKIDAADLFGEYVNIAAAQQYIGKETTFFGCVTSIDVDYCTMNVGHSATKTVTVFLETSVLANFNVGDIKVITGVVSAVKTNGYDIKDAKVAEESIANTFIQNCIATIFQDHTAQMLNNCNIDIICQYVSNHPSVYCFESQKAAESYISDSWMVYACTNNEFYQVGRIDLSTEYKTVYKTTYGGSKERIDGSFWITYYGPTQALRAFHAGQTVANHSSIYRMSEDYCLAKATFFKTYQTTCWYLLQIF